MKDASELSAHSFACTILIRISLRTRNASARRASSKGSGEGRVPMGESAIGDAIKSAEPSMYDDPSSDEPPEPERDGRLTVPVPRRSSS